MTIVITMAGVGSRFRQAGYDIPKYKIDAHGKALFDWSMMSLSGFMDKKPRYVFIVRAEDNASDFILSHCRMLEIKDIKIVEIDYITDGQASSAMLASPYWSRDDELLIYNIDTFVEPEEMNTSQIKGDGFIPCFTGEGNHWSFAKADEDGRVTEVKEKERISNHCTLGAYYFKTCGLYEDAYNKYYSGSGNMGNGEKYIAPLYNYLISEGLSVYICTIDKDKIHALGTPEELNIFISEYQACD